MGNILKLTLIVLASLIPGILWIRFFHIKDRFEREPVSMLLRAFVMGALAVGLAAVVEMPFSSWVLPDAPMIMQLIAAFAVIGLGEESFKALAIYLAAYRSNEFNEAIDGIIYGVTVGIGFSVVENILYAWAFGLSVAPIRASIASLAHACFSGIFGVFCGRAKFSSRPSSELLKGLAFASLSHGLYDYLLISRIGSPLTAVVLILVLYFILRYYLHQALAQSPFR
ncbi:MAG: PrsW family intramembrane metalloprotease [Firmicutes bacterium]|nr:PrsW family glutamic-type intramembrane protease [Bacillota bacterium]NLL88718.1 PrsW family intramembrane metalloprotease [Bacillota bacterium]HKM17844.1 PrsW family glutamic-type intramembrane protease [Limnochordia bacterium]